MPKHPRKAVSARQPPKGARRWLARVVVIVSLVICAGWLWLSVIEPQLLLRQAQQLLDENPRQAATLLEAAIDQSFGEYPEAQCLWSRALLRQGRQQEALGCFSLISDPAALGAEDLLLLADEANAAGEVLLANFALQAVPQQCDHFVEASHRLMELKLQQGRLLDVLALGEKVRARQVGLPLTELLMARAYEQTKELSGAVSAYERYLKTSDGEPVEQVRLVLERLMQLSLQLGRYDVARHCLDDLQKSGPLSREARLSQAELLRAEGSPDESETIVSSILDEEPTNLAAVTLRATLAFDRHEDMSAEQDLRRILQSQPWNKMAHYKLAIVLQRSGRLDEAESHFRDNRRLTELSIRVLAREKQATASPVQETARLQELRTLYDELGQPHMAERLQRQLQTVQQYSRP